MELRGTGVSAGAVAGKALVFRHERTGEEAETSPSAAPPEGSVFDAAMERFRAGRRLIYAELAALAAEAGKKYGGDKAGIFEGYGEILMDDEIEELAGAYIRKGYSPSAAAKKALEDQARELEALDNAYLRERGADLADIGRRLAGAVAGEKQTLPVAREPCILVADELSPFETVGLDHGLILGMAMDKGGYTSHVAILARSLGIPCVVALETAAQTIETGTMCALDGGSGSFVIDPDSGALELFRRKETERKRRLAVLAKTAREPAVTRDGVYFPVYANIGSPEEAAYAVTQGADGVGLFRTELLYMDSQRLPGEDEQRAMYQKTLEALAGRPLVIRTLDIGGDKAHPALGLEKEDNPFLGYRAVRVSLDQPRLFKPQLRAILRAAASGGVELMFPMLASLDEFRRARLLLDECRAELSAEGARQGNPPVGIMVETPAAAMLAREFAAEADFFSVGTNDLTQYTLAADRGNRKLAGLYNPLHPAVVRLSALTCEAALDRGIPAGICGEIAGDTQAIPLLVGLGMTKFSVPAARIPEVKERIRGLDREKCRNLARRALTLATTGEVAALLAEAVY